MSGRPRFYLKEGETVPDPPFDHGFLFEEPLQGNPFGAVHVEHPPRPDLGEIGHAQPHPLQYILEAAPHFMFDRYGLPPNENQVEQMVVSFALAHGLSDDEETAREDALMEWFQMLENRQVHERFLVRGLHEYLANPPHSALMVLLRGLMYSLRNNLTIATDEDIQLVLDLRLFFDAVNNEGYDFKYEGAFNY